MIEMSFLQYDNSETSGLDKKNYQNDTKDLLISTIYKGNLSFRQLGFYSSGLF